MINPSKPRSPSSRFRPAAAAVVPAALIATCVHVRSEDATTIRYNREVLPILSENCFACHGFDKGARKAGLRLDTREGATVELESGARAIVPGAFAGSELLLRDEQRMAGLLAYLRGETSVPSRQTP